jgi:hypothetical protein
MSEDNNHRERCEKLEAGELNGLLPADMTDVVDLWT